jgi:hypothetical protein
MKKCPACDKTYEDSMRFCQVDGTPLVDDAPFDPFATIVGVVPPKSEPAVDKSPAAASSSRPEEVPPISEPDDVLDLPDEDPLRTMYVSDAEMKAALNAEAVTAESEIVEIPPIGDVSSEETLVDRNDPADKPGGFPEPELPNFEVPDAPKPSFGDMAPPPSPFSSGSAPEAPVSAPSFDEPSGEMRQFNEAETMIQDGFSNPFESPSTPPVAEWSPAPAQGTNWENRQMGSEPGFTPTALPMASGQNKTLAIISLVTGILGLTICCGGVLPSVAAIITGIMARSKASQNPSEFGGSGMAMAGIITGVLGLLGGIIVIVFWLLGAFANMATGNF